MHIIKTEFGTVTFKAARIKEALDFIKVLRKSGEEYTHTYVD